MTMDAIALFPGSTPQLMCGGEKKGWGVQPGNEAADAFHVQLLK